MKDVIRNIIKILSRKKAKSSDDVNSNGKVLLLFKDNLDRIVKKSLGNNELSKLYKARIVFKGAEPLDGGSNVIFGKTHISNDINLVNAGSSIYGRVFKNVPRQNAIVLLNLTGKAVTDNYIPIHDETGNIDRSVVIGWFNGNTVETGDDYLGVDVSQTMKGLFNGIARERRGYFDKLKANGTITHVALMDGIGKPGPGNVEYQGSIAWQNICKSLVNSAWCPPNTPGITAENEIAIFNNTDGVAGYKINLDTGDEVPTVLDGTSIDWAGGTTARGATLLFDTNKLAVVDNKNICKLLQINGDGTFTQLSLTNFGLEGSPTEFGVFVYDGYLYFSYGQLADSTVTTRISTMYKIDLATYSRTIVKNRDNPIIGGLPIGWDIDQINVLAYHNGKFYVRRNGIDYGRQDDIIMCTNLADISGTICGTLTSEFKNFSVISTPNEQDILIGSNMQSQSYIKNGTSQTKYYVNESKEYVYTDATNENVQNEINLANDSVRTIWISKAYGNWWTLFPLAPPEKKTDIDKLDVIYTISWKDV